MEKAREIAAAAVKREGCVFQNGKVPKWESGRSGAEWVKGYRVMRFPHTARQEAVQENWAGRWKCRPMVRWVRVLRVKAFHIRRLVLGMHRL